jgi:hypothetical protein
LCVQGDAVNSIGMTKATIATLVTTISLAATLFAGAPASAQTPPYDLGPLPAGFTVQWPTLPRVTRSVNVSTLADFNRAASVAGTLITITAMISGSGTINASDIEVHMAAGASLGGLYINKNIKRIALYGGSYTNTIEFALASQFWPPPRVDNPAWVIEDVMMDGINVRSATNTALFIRGHRVALLRSFAYAADYAVYVDTINQDQTSNLIIAANNLQAEGRQATQRMWNVRNSVTVDNRLTDLLLTGSKHNYRVHGVSDQVFAARNELVNAGVMLATIDGDDVGHLWFNNNTFHHNTADLFNPDRTRLHVLQARNNVAYTNVWSCFYCLGPLAGWDLANNVIKPYQPPPPPPPGMPTGQLAAALTVANPTSRSGRAGEDCDDDTQ